MGFLTVALYHQSDVGFCAASFCDVDIIISVVDQPLFCNDFYRVTESFTVDGNSRKFVANFLETK